MYIEIFVLYGAHIENHAKRTKNINRLQPNPSSRQCLGPLCELCYIYPQQTKYLYWVPYWQGP